MTDLTPRQQLIKELFDDLDFAIQTDFENGVNSLNVAASEELSRKYPSITNLLNYIKHLYYDEVPLD